MHSIGLTAETVPGSAVSGEHQRASSPVAPQTEEGQCVAEDLREREAWLTAVINSSVDGLITIRQDGIVTSFNRAAERIFGYRAEEVIGRDVKILMPEPYRTAHAGYVASYARTGQPRIIGIGREVRGRRKDGSVFPMDLAVGELPHRPGALEFVGSVRDITARLGTEAQLVQAQKMEAVGNLTGGMAHDFNNLLGIIIGNLDLLRDHHSGDPDSEELTGEALGAALRGADLTRRLLAFARRQPLQPARIDVNELIAGIVKLLKRTLGEEIQIVLDLNTRTWPVVADAAQLEAALANLATNARDAMPGGGQLTIVTGNRPLDADYASQHAEVRPGDYAMIEITDTGCGMSPEVASRIFEPFYTTKEPGKGTGLGLSMVFGFIKQSGGHVNVYSEAGIGTTFRLYLPRAGAGIEAGEVTSSAVVARGSGEIILAVEDNASLRRVVARQLTELGYRVLEAEDAQAALGIIESEAVDVLFSDVVMPGGTSGYELAQTVRFRRPWIKIVLTSGFPENRANGNTGASTLPLLSKPYRRADLGRILREVLDA